MVTWWCRVGNLRKMSLWMWHVCDFNLKCAKHGSPETSKFQVAKQKGYVHTTSILVHTCPIFSRQVRRSHCTSYPVTCCQLHLQNRGVRLTMNVQNLIPYLAVDPIHLPVPVDRLDRWIWAFMAGVPHSATPKNANIHKCSQLSTFRFASAIPQRMRIMHTKADSLFDVVEHLGRRSRLILVVWCGLPGNKLNVLSDSLTNLIAVADLFMQQHGFILNTLELPRTCKLWPHASTEIRKL